MTKQDEESLLISSRLLIDFDDTRCPCLEKYTSRDENTPLPSLDWKEQTMLIKWLRSASTFSLIIFGLFHF